MYKSLSNICILGALGFLIMTLVRPELANKTTNKILSAFDNPRASSEIADAGPDLSFPQTFLPTTESSFIRTIGTRQSTQVDSSYIMENVGVLSNKDISSSTNNERIKMGIAPLRFNNELEKSAAIKANDMLKYQYFEHMSPTGQGVADLGVQAGYDYVIMGENLALGNFDDSDDVVQAWMNSPGHKANILNPTYEEIGVYAVKGMYDGKMVWIAVQHFGTERSACPSISTTLKKSIDGINADLKQRQAQISNEKAYLEGPNHPEGDEYKTKVTEFNKLVIEYNTTLVISQDKIKAYNAQVSAFNTCLSKFQLKQ